MLLEPDGSPAWRSEDVLRRCRPSWSSTRAARRTGSRSSSRPTRTRPSARRPRELRDMRAGLADDGALARPARRGRRHPPARARRGRRGLAGRPLPVPAPSAARARPPRADVRAARARRRPRPGARGPRASTACAPTSPCCSALAANSPVHARRDCGLASRPHARLPGVPAHRHPARVRRPTSAYVEAIDVLIRCGAIPEPTFIWWDVRLQPKLGTLEVRVMDAQTRIRDTAALVALVQCLVRLRGARRRRRARALPRAGGARREPLPRRARRHRRRSCSTRTATAACPPRAAWRRWSTPAGRTPARSAASASSALLAHLAGDPGATRQRAIAANPASRASCTRYAADFSPPRPRLALAA